MSRRQGPKRKRQERDDGPPPTAGSLPTVMVSPNPSVSELKSADFVQALLSGQFTTHGHEPTVRGGEKICLIGRGGFGEVWKVRYLNSEEAWKFLPKRPGSDFQAVREALNARRVEHPNIVRVQDIEEDPEHFILRMDLVRGRDLYRVVRDDGVLPPGALCRYALQVAEALEAAHRAGVLHLDLKPSNLILTERAETVMITDFGISATLQKGPFEHAGAALGGTPHFLAPEELRARAGDEVSLGPATDIWALGVTLYYLLSRAYPFELVNGDPSPILEATPRPLPELRPYVPDELWALIAKMLSKDPKDRFASMEAVRAAVRSYLDTITCPACSTRCEVETLQDRCPDKGCPSPERLPPFARARSLLRLGDDFFARSDFSRAIATYSKVLENHRSEPDAADRANRLIEAAKSDREDLDRHVAKVRERLESAELLAALQEVDAARRCFSTSPDLRRLRSQILREVYGRSSALETTTAKLIQEARFDEARARLETMQSLLEYRPLLSVLEESREFQERPLQRIRSLLALVEERRRLHEKWHDELETELQALELGSAARILQRIQNDFPHPENAARIRLYSDLQESLHVVRQCDPERLAAELASPEGELPKEPVELVHLCNHCDYLLANLDARSIPALEEITRYREAMKRAMGMLLARRDLLREQADTAERGRQPRELLAALEGQLEIAERTDIFTPEEAAGIRERYEKLWKQIERAEKKHAEALRLLEENDAGGALVAFEAAESISPGLFPEIHQHIDGCERRIQEHRLAAESLREAYDEVVGGTGSRAACGHYLELARRLEEEEQQGLVPRYARRTREVLARLALAETQALEGSSSPDAALDVLAAATRLIATLPQESLIQVFFEEEDGQQAALSRLLEVFFHRAGGFDAPLDTEIARLERTIDALVPLKHVLQSLPAPEGGLHAAERLGERIAALRGSIAERIDSRAHLERLLALHLELDTLAGEDVRRRLARDRVELHSALRRIAWRAARGRVGRAALWAAVPVLSALAGASAVLFTYAREGRDLQLELTSRVAGALASAPEAGTSSGRGGQDLAEFLRSLTVFATRPEERARTPGISIAPAAALNAAVTLDRVSGRLHALEKLESAPRDLRTGSWKSSIRAQRRELIAQANRTLDELAARSIEAIAQRALEVRTDGDCLEPIEEVAAVLAAALGLARRFGGLEALQRIEEESAWVEEAREQLGARPFRLDAFARWLFARDGAVRDEVFLVAHACAVARAASDLEERTAQVHRVPGAAVGLEEELHSQVRSVLDYREMLRAHRAVRPVLGKLFELRAPPLEDTGTASPTARLLETLRGGGGS